MPNDVPPVPRPVRAPDLPVQVASSALLSLLNHCYRRSFMRLDPGGLKTRVAGQSDIAIRKYALYARDYKIESGRDYAGANPAVNRKDVVEPSSNS